MLPMEGNRNGPFRRSSSVPVTNPFWSQRTREEAELVAARPAGLPSTPLDELDGMDETSSERLPVRDARRGGRSRSQDRSGGSWRTPELQLPVSWAGEGGRGLRDGFPRWLRAGLREVPGGSRGHGAPERVGEGLRTMGRMPLSPRRTDGQVPQSLETALEDVMVGELLKKNKDLQDQVAKLMEEKKKGSESSWSEVVEPVEPRTPTRRPEGGVRFTPNGTAVPPDTPRENSEVLPPVPPMPTWDLQGYEVEETSRPKGKQMDWVWIPGGKGVRHPGQVDRGAGSRHGSVDRGAGSRHGGAERGASSRQEHREGDPGGLDGVQYLYERTQSLESQVAEMKSWQEQVSELKDLLEKQQRTSEQRWSGYFSTPVHSYGREQHDHRGGREEEEDPESRPSEGQTTSQRTTGDGAGNVNTTRELPVLEAGQNTSPLVLGDWLASIAPVMKDISPVSATWWMSTKRAAEQLYETWRSATPLERVRMQPGLPKDLRTELYTRTEQRGLAMLLKAVPTVLRTQLIAERQLSSTAVLYKLLVVYQPGGSGEKSLILRQLQEVKCGKNMADLANGLRDWRRFWVRAVEMKVALPDGTLVMKTLEKAVQMVAKADSQAAYRLATSRALLKVDEAPLPEVVYELSQCILAEVETLQLMQSGVTVEEDPKVKQLLSTPDTRKKGETSSPGEGHGKGSPEKPCKFWGSEEGCRAGSKCKFGHSWDQIKDKNARCWVCSSLKHRKAECPLRGGTTGKGSSTEHGEGGKSHGGGKDGAKGSGKKDGFKGKAAKAQVQQEGKSGGGETSTSSTTRGEASKGLGTQTAEDRLGTEGELLQEAAQIIKTIRGPSLRTVALYQLGGGDGMVLSDSGATHALRPAKDSREWQEAKPVTVSLAEGTTKGFRVKKFTKVLLSEPEVDTPWILPLGGMAKAGFNISWKDEECAVQDPEGRDITVDIKDGCPMVSFADGKKIMDCLERFYEQKAVRVAMMNALAGRVDHKTTDPTLLMMMWMRKEYPKLPEEVIMRTIPDLSKEVDTTKLPWNRRKRRSLEKAERVVLHLFSGRDEKCWQQLEDGRTQVLCVDVLLHGGSDLNNDNVFRYLLDLAVRGKICGVIGGPPCRTTSPCRYRQPGPRPVRSKAEPYGMATLTSKEAEQVISDVCLWFRMQLVYILAEQYKPQWWKKVLFACEQPRDPDEYREDGTDYFSVWQTEEWKTFQQRFQLQMTTFDQGALGHAKRKPATIGHNIPHLHELHGMTGQGSETTDKWSAEQDLEKRLEQTSQWAAWAPGLKAALIAALQRWLRTLPTSGENDEGEPHQRDQGVLEDCRELRHGGDLLQEGVKLTKLKPADEATWREHFLNDHLPHRRDCRHCAQAQARSKPHPRLVHASAYTLSVDMSGRMKHREKTNTGKVRSIY